MKNAQDVATGEFLTLVRTSGLSIPKIAQAAEISQRTIENWLYAGIRPTFSNAIKVLNAIGYDIALIKDREPIKEWRAK